MLHKNGYFSLLYIIFKNFVVSPYIIRMLFDRFG